MISRGGLYMVSWVAEDETMSLIIAPHLLDIEDIIDYLSLELLRNFLILSRC